jgi:tRNA pseudouridine55 synthase
MIPLREASGVLLVDKPAGMSSAEVTNHLKKKFDFKRIGHGGTLDPFATGLLVVLIGDGTKAARFLLEGEKIYEAEAALGSETDTGDPTGETVATCEVPSLSLADWEKAALPFKGFQNQTPPAYSAIKVKGKALYEYARKGQTVEIKEREIHLRETKILGADATSMRFRVTCSGGTYVRVLANDIAKAAGTCAHLSALRRTGSSSFRVENALPLEALLALEPAQVPMLGLKTALSHLPVVACNDFEVLKVRQGYLPIFDSMRPRIEKPGYFLVVLDRTGGPVAIANHHPMIDPFCSLERVFDPRLAEA